ncbi:IS66 family transposase [Marinomonas sp. IMCC 4694]|nr:IS66 family transposase [Marinomonas sp. IMCC 4694]
MSFRIRQYEAEVWALKRELFGPKSERRGLLTPDQQALADIVGPMPAELTRLEDASTVEKDKPESVSVRGKAPKSRNGNEINLTGLRFDETIPVREKVILADELQGPNAHEYEAVGFKEVSCIVQKTSAYEIVITKRQVVKHKASKQLITAPQPDRIFDSSVADVSFIVGLLINKFLYHLPLYRQHQQLSAAGITLSRATLTNLTKRGIELLRPIVIEQLISVLDSNTLAMDETPIKVTRQPGVGNKPGKMKQAYFWPVYGDKDEVVFTFSQSRGMKHIQDLLDHVWQGTLLTDGYAAYSRYEAKSPDITHAQCWVHMRRQLLKAEREETDAVTHALNLIAALYKQESHIQQKGWTGEKKQDYRAQHSKPLVDQFFAFCEEQNQRADLLPDDSWMKALNYTLKRKRQLMVFLENPDVAMDTNHLEREIRPIPMGKKNWLFCWTELGAEHVGIIQSLISTCKLHDIDPNVYLTDVLQRVSQHPAKDTADLIPRRWKPLFADNPLKSPLL